VLRIRFQRIGRKNQPFYRLVLAEHARPVKTKFIELLGHYNPLVKPKILEVKADRVSYWVGVGAQPSQTVARLLAKNGIQGMEKFIEKRMMKPSNAELETQKRKEEEVTAKKAAHEEAQQKKAADAASAAQAAEAPAETPAPAAPIEVAEVPTPEAPVEIPAAPAAETPVTESAEPEAPAVEEPAAETPAPEEEPKAE